ncbi:hypothetical protein SLEP1_g10143 [Rubroshorea leprosula]|uniref:Disease resistance protein RGA3 n=1 Tax=Rubroshorea leprosula TaxID=152421 RepID=A0AAV5I777_9ROSI|nr:hypothetical protein SLEP1_g10143 [Rubroshorea leprosula]
MADAVVSTIVQQVSTLISETAFVVVSLLWNVEGEVEKLSNSFSSIKALLEDADEKQISNKAVKLWFDRLKEESLDMEDALDEWKTVLLHEDALDEWKTVLPHRPTAGAEEASLQRKVSLFLHRFSFNRVRRYYRIARNIMEINGRLDEIAKEKDRYVHLLLTDRATSGRPVGSTNPRETASFIDESGMVGRDEVKKEIISHLLCGSSTEEEGSSIQTISIVGIGGIGKTALAQLVYNHEDVKQHFTRIWTCVSDTFTVKEIAKAMIAELESTKKAEVEPNVPLNALLTRIESSIRGKKYLLILDDVWTNDKEDFGGLNVILKSGAPGSRILVTTRDHAVARGMESSHIIPLKELSEELCWSILKKKALRRRDKETCEDFEAVGRQIAGKCKGLPLVAKTLGGLLQVKDAKKQWLEVLNSELWGMEIVHKEVFVPLLLSYYDLPSPIKECLAYCAVFAKDKRIYTCHLIAHWRAQGFLGLDDGDDASLELKGVEYFKCLMARSFFQDDCRPYLFYSDRHGPYHFKCKMHDLVHDFLLFLTKGEFMTEIVKIGDKSLKLNSEGDKTCRHLTLMADSGLHFPESISDAEKLRTVVSDAVTSEKALCNLFNQASRLRLLELDMQKYEGSTIPEDLANLLHLRYLNLAHCYNLKRLPKALCRLYNLQFLDLYSCFEVKQLPTEIENLVNLKLLRTTACLNLTCYPKEVGRLTRLTQLIGLIVRVDCDDPNEFSIGDLKNLELLVVLSMKIVGNRINRSESRKVNLQKLEEVKILKAGTIAEAGDAILESLNMSYVPRWSFEEDYYMHGPFSSSRNECFCYGFF